MCHMSNHTDISVSLSKYNCACARESHIGLRCVKAPLCDPGQLLYYQCHPSYCGEHAQPTHQQPDAMAELLSMVFDDDDETCVTALYSVCDIVLQLKQKPHEGRAYNKEKEDLQEYAMAHPEEAYHPSSANGEYDSAFPNVGLVIWQSGFVLADYLLRAAPLGSLTGLRILELGCGTGQLGIVLALAGADVTLTDLDHITPLTQANVTANMCGCAVPPKVVPYMWGTPVTQMQHALQQQQQQQQQHNTQRGQQQQQQQQPEAAGVQDLKHVRQISHHNWDMIVAADVLYEPQHYDELLDSLMQLCPAPGGCGGATQEVVGSCCSSTPGGPAPAVGMGLAVGGQQHGDKTHSCATDGGNDLASTSNCQRSPLVCIAYRVRRYGEHGFESKAEKCGFEVSVVPIEELHADYQCGGYRVIQLRRVAQLPVSAS